MTVTDRNSDQLFREAVETGQAALILTDKTRNVTLDEADEREAARLRDQTVRLLLNVAAVLPAHQSAQIGELVSEIEAA